MSVRVVCTCSRCRMLTVALNAEISATALPRCNRDLLCQYCLHGLVRYFVLLQFFTQKIETVSVVGGGVSSFPGCNSYQCRYWRCAGNGVGMTLTLDYRPPNLIPRVAWLHRCTFHQCSGKLDCLVAGQRGYHLCSVVLLLTSL